MGTWLIDPVVAAYRSRPEWRHGRVIQQGHIEVGLDGDSGT